MVSASSVLVPFSSCANTGQFALSAWPSRAPTNERNTKPTARAGASDRITRTQDLLAKSLSVAAMGDRHSGLGVVENPCRLHKLVDRARENAVPASTPAATLAVSS